MVASTRRHDATPDRFLISAQIGMGKSPPTFPAGEKFVLRVTLTAVKANTTTSLLGSELQPLKQSSVNPRGKRPGTHRIWGWEDLKVGLDSVEKRKFFTLLRLELRPLVRPPRSQSLYRLRYPGSEVDLLLTNFPGRNETNHEKPHAD
jgi:hypothetical protein